MKLPWMQLTAVLALGSSTSALKVTIIADQNRDGKVNCEDSGIKDRCASGAPDALFLPAITDTDRRCSDKIKPEDDQQDFEECHDGADNVLRHPERLAPIITKPVRGLSGGSTGTLSITCDQDKWEGCDSKVRIFQQHSNGNWTYVDTEKREFSEEELQTGLKLGIDGRDVRRPGIWDGRVHLSLHVEDSKSGKKASDCVALRVAPVLTHHHLQKTDRVFSFIDHFNYEPYAQTAEDIIDAVQANSAAPVYQFENYEDLWTQDFFEPAYASIPGPKGGRPISIRVMIRNSVEWTDAGRAVFEELRSADVGAVQYLRAPEGTPNPDGLGNLETIPPYEKSSAKYPAGRAIMGVTRSEKPRMLELLQAQEVQDPLELNTDWLEIGHVDEFLQFLPASNARGWVMMVADPAAGIALLRKAQSEGHGSKLATSRPPKPYDDPGFGGCIPNDTIAEVLKKENMIVANEYADESIDINMDILKNETGLTDGEILRIPAVYWTDTWACPLPDFGDDDDEDDDVEDGDISEDNSTQERVPAPKMQKNKRQMIRDTRMRRTSRDDPPKIDFPTRPPGLEYGLSSFYPASINGLVLPGAVVTGNPWGPVIDGVDIFAEAVLKSYASVGINVTFVDDWASMRVGQGGIHCATNSWRQAGPGKWW